MTCYFTASGEQTVWWFWWGNLWGIFSAWFTFSICADGEIMSLGHSGSFRPPIDAIVHGSSPPNRRELLSAAAGVELIRRYGNLKRGALFQYQTAKYTRVTKTFRNLCKLLKLTCHKFNKRFTYQSMREVKARTNNFWIFYRSQFSEGVVSSWLRIQIGIILLRS